MGWPGFQPDLSRLSSMASMSATSTVPSIPSWAKESLGPASERPGRDPASLGILPAERAKPSLAPSGSALPAIQSPFDSSEHSPLRPGEPARDGGIDRRHHHDTSFALRFRCDRLGRRTEAQGRIAENETPARARPAPEVAPALRPSARPVRSRYNPDAGPSVPGPGCCCRGGGAMRGWIGIVSGLAGLWVGRQRAGGGARGSRMRMRGSPRSSRRISTRRSAPSR